MRAISLGVIGLGRIGKLHLENVDKWIPGFKVQAVTDPLLDREYLSQYSIPNITADPMDVLNDSTIDAILIATPVESHTELITLAAKQGKHIFCEKPLALTEDDIFHIMKVVEKAGVKCQVGFNRRFDPNFAKVQQQVQSGKLGKPYLLRITSRDPALPSVDYLKQSGGLFFDMTIHDFDMARFLIGEEIESIYATGGAYVSSDVAACHDIDTAVINLKFKSGVLGIIENCRHAEYGYDQRVEVLCEKGSIRAENTRPTSVILRNHDGETVDKPHYFFLERYAQSYINELNAFYTAIVRNEATLVSAKDALAPLWMAQGANQSMQSRENVCLKKLGEYE